MMQIRFIPNDKDNPPGKLADAELVFTDGPLVGMKLVGFAVWEGRNGGPRNVTFPSRQYSVNGERRSYALFRQDGHDTRGYLAVRDEILARYAEAEQEQARA